jgi:hypothetical protein
MTRVHSARVVGIASAALGLLMSASAPGAMPRREPPLLLGGARERIAPQIPLDPALPTGAKVGGTPRPSDVRQRMCSWRRPVCVHTSRATFGTGEAALSALEWAYDTAVFALGLPEPLADDGAGGTDALDAYLVGPDGELAVEAERLLLTPFTSAPAYCVLPVSDEALLRRAATQCVGEAVALALDASEPPHLRRAFATSLWWAVGSPTSLDVQALDDVQSHPELAIATRELGPTSEGAALFFTYLERARSAGSPGQLSAALFSAAASNAADAAWTFRNEPDLFDVLRHSLEEDPARMGALMVDLSVTRAFLGQREDGQHLPELAWGGSFGRARFDWVVPFSSLPRRVAIQPPVDSTGTALVWMELDEVPIGSALAMRAEWEAPVSFQWQLVKISATGAELGRVDVPFQQRGREAEARVTGLEEAAAVLVVGTNLEGIELAHPFDPDVSPFEPHGLTIYFARL